MEGLHKRLNTMLNWKVGTKSWKGWIKRLICKRLNRKTDWKAWNKKGDGKGWIKRLFFKKAESKERLNQKAVYKGRLQRLSPNSIKKAEFCLLWNWWLHCAESKATQKFTMWTKRPCGLLTSSSTAKSFRFSEVSTTTWRPSCSTYVRFCPNQCKGHFERPTPKANSQGLLKQS